MPFSVTALGEVAEVVAASVGQIDLGEVGQTDFGEQVGSDGQYLGEKDVG
jgi:hypothetical protein